MRNYRKETAELLAPEVPLSAQEVEALLEVPPKDDMGDLAFPCFRLAKELRKAPPAIAGELAEALADKLPEWVKEVKALGPYLNIFFEPSAYAVDVLSDIIEKGDTYGCADIGEGKRIVIDYSSPNIAKPFHVGHAFSTLLGQAIGNLYGTLGFEPVRLNHLGDYGTQFGKLISAWKRWGDREALEENAIEELTRVYVKFHQEAEAHPELEDEARDHFRRLEQGEAMETELWQEFRDLSLKEFNRIYDRLGVHFDNYNGESFYSDKIPAVVDMLKEKGLLELSEGAQVVDLSAYDLNPCLILKSDGTTTYASRDIAAIYYRDQTWDFFRNIYVVGLPQDNHFKQVFAVMERAGFDHPERNVFVGFGTVKFADGDFSTRSGNIIKLDELLNKSVAKTREIIKQNNPDMSEAELDATAEAVGIAAVEYTYLKNGRERDIFFDWDEMLDFEGDTAPYLLYTYTRAGSILRKAGDWEPVAIDRYTAMLTDPQEMSLLKIMAGIPATVIAAAENREPSILLREISRLARAFNSYYHDHPILKAEEEDTRIARLILTKAVQTVIKRGLDICGIPTVERM